MIDWQTIDKAYEARDSHHTVLWIFLQHAGSNDTACIPRGSSYGDNMVIPLVYSWKNVKRKSIVGTFAQVVSLLYFLFFVCFFDGKPMKNVNDKKLHSEYWIPWRKMLFSCPFYKQLFLPISNVTSDSAPLYHIMVKMKYIYDQLDNHQNSLVI